jgi:hypothetical protein
MNLRQVGWKMGGESEWLRIVSRGGLDILGSTMGILV